MPKYYEFVFTAYGLWIGVFAIYLVHLYRKARGIDRALESLEGSGESPAEDQ